ncbi:hypothetical protein [Ferruginibacter profundus]
MKKINYLLGIAALIIVASCSNQSLDSNQSKEMKRDEMKMDNMKMDSTQMDSTTHNKLQMMDSMDKK